MKPLVLYCRWHQARLRLHGRSNTAVWGEIDFASGQVQPFRYHLERNILELQQDEHHFLSLELDDQGVIINQR